MSRTPGCVRERFDDQGRLEPGQGLERAAGAMLRALARAAQTVRAAA